MKMIAMLAIAACTTNNNNYGNDKLDAAPTADAAPSHDAPQPPIDAPPVAGYTQVPLACTDYTLSVTYLSQSGLHDITTESWALVDLGFGADFIIIQCQPGPVVQPCVSGETCSGTNIPPGTVQCLTTKNGDFRDGKLAVHCGTRFQRIEGNGTVDDDTTTNYTVILEAR